MAVALTVPAHYQRDTPPSGTNQTWCCWFKINNQPGGDLAFNAIIAQDANANSWINVEVDADAGSTSRITVWANPTAGGDAPRITGPLVDYDEWYFVALVKAGNNYTLYWRHNDDDTLSSTSATWTSTIGTTKIRFGAEHQIDVDTALDGALAHCRIFTSALSASDVLAESNSPTAVAAAWADWPIASTTNHTTDASGNNRPLTATASTGGFADTTGPAFAQQGERDATATTGPVAASGTRSAVGDRSAVGHTGQVAASAERAGTGDREGSAHTGAVSATAERAGAGDREATATTGPVAASGSGQAAGSRAAEAHTGQIVASAEREAPAATRDATAWTGTAAATADRTAASGVRDVTAHTGSIAAAAERETPGSTRDVTATTGSVTASAERAAAGTRQTGSHTGQIAATASRTVPGATRDATAHTGRTAASGSRVGHAHRAGSGHVRPVVASADAAGVTRTRDVTAHARRCVASGSRTGRTVREATCTARRITAEAATFIPPDEPAARVRFVTRTRPLATMEVTT